MSDLMMLFLITAFLLKHFLLDFVLQPPWMWMNKGTYGHPGGLVHAGLHGLASYCILVFFAPASIAMALVIIEVFVHYHMDWFKMWLNKAMDWKCNEHPEFWYLTGFDQFVHYMTYVVIIGFIL